jgi:CHASE2 domain-containing sensor protein
VGGVWSRGICVNAVARSRWLAGNRVAAGDQWLRRPAPSDLKVIVVDIDRGSIDALGTWPWPRERMARLVEAVATGRHP